jgi:TonB family protein
LIEYDEVSVVEDDKHSYDYFSVKLKLTVDPKGDVTEVETLQTSGHPDVDLDAIRYAKKWKFQGLNPDRPEEDQQMVFLLRLKPKDSTEKQNLDIR